MSRKTRMRGSALMALVTALAASSCSSGTGSAADGSAGSAATSGPGRAPPAGRIVFRRYSDSSDTSGALFTRSPDGATERRLTRPAAFKADQQPDWSPDGQRVLFTRIVDVDGDHESHRLAEVAADGSRLRFLSPRARGSAGLSSDDGGAFSPDGRQIAFVHASGLVKDDQPQHVDVWVMDADGSHRRNLIMSAPYSGGRDGVAWSPDGRRLVFSVGLSFTSTPPEGRALFVINTDGSGLRRLTPWKLGADGVPDWSKQGLIVLRAVGDEESGIGNFFTIHPDGSGLRQITHFRDKVVSHKVGFSPDGRWIVYGHTGTGGANDVYVARVDGSGERNITHTPQEEGSPSWTS